MVKKSKAKVYIDGANMFYTQKDLGWFIDWKKVKLTLKKEYQVLEFRYYTGVKPKDEKMKRYLRYLDKIGFTVVSKPLKIIKIEKDHPLRKLYQYSQIYKSNFDVEMTTDILLEQKELDWIILFTGDSDFDYLVKKLKSLLKKNVVVYSSRKMLSWELKLSVSRYVFLEDLKEKIKRGKT